MQKVFQVLHDVFGYAEFRAGQQNLVFEILSGHDVLGVLPTGGGKSLCYQLPALLLDGVTLVISPLIALMKDQVDTLKALHVPAEILNTSVSFDESRLIYQSVFQKQTKLLYIAPERLENEYFIAQAVHWNIAMIAVDEAHCVSSWGHDFRPSYKKIKDFVSKLGTRPVLAAFTATATKQTQQDIIKQLALKNPFVQINSFDRKNILFKTLSPYSKQQFLLNELQHEIPAIVYCNTRKTVDKVFDLLQKNKLPCEKYHAGLSFEERKSAQEHFLENKSSIIVATNAFGMGIDKKDVRTVLHYNMPKNIESYYQEAGRAGRDGLPSRAILLYSKKDFAVARYLIRDSKEPLVYEKLQRMIDYCESGSCLRKKILHYFGEESESALCGNCSVCCASEHAEEDSPETRREELLIDKTIEAQKILSCIYRVKQNFGAGMIVAILRESKSEKLLAKNFHRLSTYGIMKEYAVKEIQAIIAELLYQNFLMIGEYHTLKITALGMQLLKSEVRFSMIDKSENKKPNMINTLYCESIQNEALFERLKELRNRLAKKQAVPPFVIFSNKTLMNIAAELPQTEEAFLCIEGIGKVKCEKYAHSFLRAVREFTAEHPDAQRCEKCVSFIEPDANGAQEKSASYCITLELYNEGKSIAEIARLRSLTVGTILDHLRQCVAEHTLTAVRNELDSETFSAIKRAVDKVGSSRLIAIKAEVGDHVSYAAIRLALLVLQCGKD